MYSPGLIDMHIPLESETHRGGAYDRYTQNPPDAAFLAARYTKTTLTAGFTADKFIATTDDYRRNLMGDPGPMYKPTKVSVLR